MLMINKVTCGRNSHGGGIVKDSKWNSKRIQRGIRQGFESDFDGVRRAFAGYSKGRRSKRNFKGL